MVFIKVVANAKYGEILGTHRVSPDVTELLPEPTLVHNAEFTAEGIARNVHTTLIETAYGVEGSSIHIQQICKI